MINFIPVILLIKVPSQTVVTSTVLYLFWADSLISVFLVEQLPTNLYPSDRCYDEWVRNEIPISEIIKNVI